MIKKKRNKLQLLAFMMATALMISFATPAITARAAYGEIGGVSTEVDLLNNEDPGGSGGAGGGSYSSSWISKLFNYKTSSTGYSAKGYNASAGERTINGYVQNNANPEVSLRTQSSGFNNANGGVFKRIGASSHGGIAPHIHTTFRNIAPDGTVHIKIGTKTSNGGVVSPKAKDAKQLYEYINNGKYQ